MNSSHRGLTSLTLARPNFLKPRCGENILLDESWPLSRHWHEASRVAKLQIYLLFILKWTRVLAETSEAKSVEKGMEAYRITQRLETTSETSFIHFWDKNIFALFLAKTLIKYGVNTCFWERIQILILKWYYCKHYKFNLNVSVAYSAVMNLCSIINTGHLIDMQNYSKIISFYCKNSQLALWPK